MILDAQRTSLTEERDPVLLRSGKLVKAMSLEYAPLLADIYWTRVVQFYGNKRMRGQANLELLWPLLDNHDDTRSKFGDFLPVLERYFSARRLHLAQAGRGPGSGN